MVNVFLVVSNAAYLSLYAGLFARDFVAPVVKTQLAARHIARSMANLPNFTRLGADQPRLRTGYGQVDGPLKAGAGNGREAINFLLMMVSGLLALALATELASWLSP